MATAQKGSAAASSINKAPRCKSLAKEICKFSIPSEGRFGNCQCSGCGAVNALSTVRAADDICTFLPGIGEAEYELRAKLRTMRNCAAAMIAKTDSDTARALAWTCSEYATAYVYAGVDQDTLSEVGRFCNRLMLTAIQAETIDDWRH